jgi:hypothetical protein
MTRLILPCQCDCRNVGDCDGQNRHRVAPATYSYNRCYNAVSAAGYAGYNPCNDPTAAFVGGTCAGSDPDPRIRAELIREFGRYGHGR